MRPRTAPGSRFAGHSSRAAQSPSQIAQQQPRSRPTLSVLPVWAMPVLLSYRQAVLPFRPFCRQLLPALARDGRCAKKRASRPDCNP